MSALVHTLIVAAIVLLSVAGSAVVGFIAWRLYRWRHPGTARVTVLPLA